VRCAGRGQLAAFFSDAGLRIPRLGLSKLGDPRALETLGEGVSNHEPITQGAGIMRSDIGGSGGSSIELG
jgi:hypothetical protein